MQHRRDTVPEFTKSERAKLRDLAGEAYERELGTHLEELHKSFELWRRGEMYSSELSKQIHEFHQRDAREVWSAYQLPHPSMIVGRAIAFGILMRSEVPEPLLAKLHGEIAAFERVSGAA